jgi:hypothetical protein
MLPPALLPTDTTTVHYLALLSAGAEDWRGLMSMGANRWAFETDGELLLVAQMTVDLAG